MDEKKRVDLGDWRGEAISTRRALVPIVLPLIPLLKAYPSWRPPRERAGPIGKKRGEEK